MRKNVPSGKSQGQVTWSKNYNSVRQLIEALSCIVLPHLKVAISYRQIAQNCFIHSLLSSRILQEIISRKIYGRFIASLRNHWTVYQFSFTSHKSIDGCSPLFAFSFTLPSFASRYNKKDFLLPERLLNRIHRLTYWWTLKFSGEDPG